MIELTDFQEIAAMSLEIEDNEAKKIQQGWPKTQRELRKLLRQWKIITSSNVKGHELLAICDAIWQQRPSNIAELEGREILYHPIEGTPIETNDPLYGLSIEMLAFLRWAYNRNFLKWTDEIAIAREVHQAKDIIAKLPPDRFYAKNLLPHVGDEIDWRDIELAGARSFIQKGISSKLNIIPEISHDFEFGVNTLEGVLASISALSNQSTRNMLLKGLPPGPTGAIRRSSAPIVDIANIVQDVQGFGKLNNGQIGLNILIDNAIRFVKGTQLESLLETFKL